MQDFRNLNVWQVSHEFAREVYRLTKGFPREELFGLTNQLRRAAVSIPTNIAEGCGRGSDVDFARFLQIAMGSAAEVEYEIILCRDLEYRSDDCYREWIQKVVEIKRKLTRLMQTVRGIMDK